jgi:hypothetical protein
MCIIPFWNSSGTVSQFVMIRNKRLTVIALVTAALGLGGTLAAFLAEQENLPHVVAATTSKWDGTTRTAYSATTISYNGGSYYVLRTAAELAYVATDSASWSRNFLVVNDIDLGASQWTAIAQNNKVKSDPVGYSGIFDFNGHIVSNLTISGQYNSYSWGATYLTLGLFGNIEQGTVRNLNLQNVNINVTTNQTYAYVGGIAGYNYGTIESCTLANATVKATFSGSSYSNSDSDRPNAAGALVGFNGYHIKNCLFMSGSVTVKGASNWFYDTTYAGGTVYGGGDSDSVVTNVYTDTTNVTTTVSGAATDNSAETSGDLSDGTVEEAVTTINNDISANSSDEGSAALNVVNGDQVLISGQTAGTKTDTGSSSSSSTPHNTATDTDMVAEFVLLNTCSDYDKIDSYWTAYSTDAITKARFDDYTIADANGDYTAGSKLVYMHNLALSKQTGSSLIASSALAQSSEGEALLIVGAVTLSLAGAGYFLLKKKAA